MLSFKLHDEFVQSYARKAIDWGFKDGGGNSLGEITFFRTYSRKKKNGTKEHWHEVCRRVIEGYHSIMKDHCRTHRLPWSEVKAQTSAQEAYDLLFSMKWMPPGRGLWMMGTDFVHEMGNSAALQNCAFVSTAGMTRLDPERPAVFLMEASMLGVGVGFDTRGVDRGIVINEATVIDDVHVITDDREGWVNSTGMVLHAYLATGTGHLPTFDYSEIRAAGEPIKGFGGTAAGPQPLIDLHNALHAQFTGRDQESLTSRDIVDVMNLIGKCVVAGNVRRSAELALGDFGDEDFINLKNWEENPERMDKDNGWGWASNNSVSVSVGDDYDSLIPRIADNGEPGLVFLDVTRKYGRLEDQPDHKDHRVMGFNPCAEQPLESYEMCTLVETFPSRCDDLEDFKRVQKFAYQYAKAVTLLPTHWPETNAVMQRNRRIGDSASGQAEFVEMRGYTELRKWLDGGYHEVRRWDSVYSEWLGVRESIRVTTVKPSGSVSLLAGVTPGVHWPVADTYIRRIRIGKDHSLVAAMKEAGYVVEDVPQENDTVVVEIPIHGTGLRTERDVTLFEKAALAVLAQRWWSDNGVSITLSFDKELESEHIGTILKIYEGQLKAVSFLPMSPLGEAGAYTQMPYEAITDAVYEERSKSLQKIKWGALYRSGEDAVGERYCTTDACELPVPAPA